MSNTDATRITEHGIEVPVLTDEFIAAARARDMSTRARFLLEKLIEHGSYTVDQLQDDNYQDGASVRRDLNDAGVDVLTSRTPSSRQAGSATGTYSLLGTITSGKRRRKAIPRKFANTLKETFDYKCQVCSGVYPADKLQPDHRVPFGVGGDKPTFEIEDFMPLCGRDNRAKSFTCERCENYKILDPEICMSCYWANPQGKYTHVAMSEERQLSVTFQGEDIAVFDRIEAEAETAGMIPSEYIKVIASGCSTSK